MSTDKRTINRSIGMVPQNPMQEAAKARWDALEQGSQSREVHYNAGYDVGYEAAAADYVVDQVRLDTDRVLKTRDDFSDAFILGFETGYYRKLAEILVN